MLPRCCASGCRAPTCRLTSRRFARSGECTRLLARSSQLRRSDGGPILHSRARLERVGLRRIFLLMVTVRLTVAGPAKAGDTVPPPRAQLAAVAALSAPCGRAGIDDWFRTGVPHGRCAVALRESVPRGAGATNVCALSGARVRARVSRAGSWLRERWTPLMSGALGAAFFASVVPQALGSYGGNYSGFLHLSRAVADYVPFFKSRPGLGRRSSSTTLDTTGSSWT